MSQETLAWLNENTLIGFTDKRGTAWHYRASDQGAEPNHYPGPVPIEDVRRRLFDWQAVKGTASNTFITPDGVTVVEDKRLFPLGRPETGVIFGYFAAGYQPHQYADWLLDNVATLIDDNLAIGSAGLLKGGAQAWVSIEVPDNIMTPEGVAFRPNLLAVTSFDGSIATTYKRVVTVVVCDNTMAAGLSEAGQQVKVRHSKYSKLRMGEARDKLGIVYSIGDDFAAEVKALAETPVSDKEWQAFLDAHTSLVDDRGEAKKGRALTIATNTRDSLNTLWNNDNRVSPWRNTGWGVVTAVNTHTHHNATVRNTTRPERNMSRAVTGGVDTLDQTTADTLTKVLAGTR